MRMLYTTISKSARRFFVATGIPVPRFARRVNRVLGTRLAPEQEPSLREEVRALWRSVERLETAEYLDRIGRRPD